MKKIKLFIETGVAGGIIDEIIEVENDTADEELNKLADEFLQNYINYGWQEWNEKEKRWI